MNKNQLGFLLTIAGQLLPDLVTKAPSTSQPSISFQITMPYQSVAVSPTVVSVKPVDPIHVVPSLRPVVTCENLFH